MNFVSLKNYKKIAKKGILFAGLIVIVFVIALKSTPIINIEIKNGNNDNEEYLVDTPLTSQWVIDGIVVSDKTRDQIDLIANLINDDSGGVIITWCDRRLTDYNVYAQRVNATGHKQWIADGKSVCSFGNDQSDPELVSDDQGGAIIAWEDYRSGTNTDIYIQRINSTGDKQWNSNGVAICTKEGSQQSHRLTSDGQGGAIIAWMDYRGVNSDIYAQKVNSSGNIQWFANGTMICNSTDAEWSPMLINDGQGGAIIAWADWRSGQMDIYAQRINSMGNTQWIANGTIICNATNEQSESRIVSDGSGGAIITWMDARDSTVSTWDIYAQHINSLGVTQWIANGTAICNATNEQCYPELDSDGYGGAIITWTDCRNGGAVSDIYVQWVNSSGDIQWIENGIVICNATANQQEPLIVKDGSGGAVIAWRDGRGGVGSDIYAQRINSKGDTQWTANGTAICTAIDTQGLAQITSDGLGGVFLIWRDYRSGKHDLYASRGNPPQSNEPKDIITTINGAETIKWIITTHVAPKQYRVLVSNISSSSYVWINWKNWKNNTILDVQINRTKLGNFKYIIEYYDNLMTYGIPDTVNVNITTVAQENNIETGDNENDDNDDNDGGGTLKRILGADLFLIAIISLITTGVLSKRLLKKICLS